MASVSEMMSELGLRLEDAAKRTFTDAFKLIALNNAVKKVANLIHPAYLTELEYVKTNVTVTAGKAAMTAALLDYKVLRGAKGILNVKVNGTSGLDCTEIIIQDKKKLENTFLSGTVQNPIFYVFGGYLYVLPTAITAIDVSFIRMPKSLLYEFTSNQADSGASSTKFDGDSADGLSAVNDYYNGAAIFHKESQQYHVIADYVGADLEFTVVPAKTSGTFSESQTFYFLTNSFDLLGLSGVECDLNEALHGLVVDFAEADCWKMDEQLTRRAAAEDAAFTQLKTLNAMYEAPEGIGTSERKRQKR